MGDINTIGLRVPEMGQFKMWFGIQDFPFWELKCSEGVPHMVAMDTVAMVMSLIAITTTGKNEDPRGRPLQ